MVTEILVWALVATSNHNALVDIYQTELVCRRDLREVRKMRPDNQWACVVRKSMERPKE